MAPKILLTDNPLSAMDIARELAPSGFDTVIARSGSPEFNAALADAEYIVGLGEVKMDDAFYKSAPKLKLVQLLSAGYDRVDIEAARRAGVPVCNNGGANAIAVAEHAILLMLAVCRRLTWLHEMVKSGRWRGNDVASVRLYELHGRTLGIIGLGNIGKKVARLAQGFGMAVQYFDIARLSEDAADALGVKFRLFNELLRTSDIVSLHVPLIPSTQHMMGAAQFRLMKPTAYLINTCRGPVVDEPALHEALTNGTIAGAGLDVFDQEPPPANNPLFTLDNVILTPHYAGPTWDNQSARFRNGFDNVERVARGEKPLVGDPGTAGVAKTAQNDQAPHKMLPKWGEIPMKRRAFLQTATAAAAMPATFAIAQPARARTLRFVPQANLTLLDPIFTTALVTINHGWAIYDTLFGADIKQNLKPQMADGYTVSDDGRTYLIKLREGLKFHNGEPVRAQDCAQSLIRWAARETIGQTVWKFVDSCGAQDDRTIKITLRQSLPIFIEAIGKGGASVPFVMPEHLARTDPFKQVTETIGSGPFKFVKAEFVPGSSVVYEKNPDYVPRQEPAEWTAGGKVAHFDRDRMARDSRTRRPPLPRCRRARSIGTSRCRPTSCRCCGAIPTWRSAAPIPPGSTASCASTTCIRRSTTSRPAAPC